MSERLLFTEAARWQLRSAIESSRRAGVRTARGLCDGVEALVRDRDELERRGTPLPEFPELPFREACIGAYRIFFRREQETTWIVGVWNTHKDSAA